MISGGALEILVGESALDDLDTAKFAFPLKRLLVSSEIYVFSTTCEDF